MLSAGIGDGKAVFAALLQLIEVQPEGLSEEPGQTGRKLRALGDNLDLLAAHTAAVQQYAAGFRHGAAAPGQAIPAELGFCVG